MRIRNPAPSEVTSRAMETCRLSFPVQLNPGHSLVKSDESVTLCSWRRTQPMRFGGRGTAMMQASTEHIPLCLCWASSEECESGRKYSRPGANS